MSPNFLISYPDLFKMQLCRLLIYCRCCFSTASFFTLYFHRKSPSKTSLLLFAVGSCPVQPLLLNTAASVEQLQTKVFLQVNHDISWCTVWIQTCKVLILKFLCNLSFTVAVLYHEYSSFQLPVYVCVGPHRFILLHTDLSSVVLMCCAFCFDHNMWF